MDKPRNKAARRAGTLPGRILQAALIFIAGLVIFSVTAFYILPLNIIEDRLKDEVMRQTGLLLSMESFERGLPFSFGANGVALSGPAAGKGLRIDRVSAGLDIPGLFTLSPGLYFTAFIGNGRLDGTVSIRPGGAALVLDASGVELKGLGPVVSFIDMGGAFGGRADLFIPRSGCPTGRVRLKGAGLTSADFRFMGFPLPLGTIEDAGLSAELSECRARVEGIWIDGSDLSARLRGDVFLASPLEASRLDMTLEIVPRGALLGKEFMLSFISAYKKSANFYSIPVRGTLGSPSAGR